MGMLEDYQARIQAAKDKANGSTKSTDIAEKLSSSPIPANEPAGVSTNAVGTSDNDAGAIVSNAVSGDSDPLSDGKGSDTEVSSTVQHAGVSEASLPDSLVHIPESVVEQIKEDNAIPATIDPQEAYCEACNKSVEDCDCVPSEDEESEESILAALGILPEQQNKYKSFTTTGASNSKEIDSIVESADTESNLNSAADIVAREYATSDDDLIVFRNIFNQTHDKVKDLFPDQLEQKIMHLDKVIKAIQAMQQACKRLASDKKEKETKQEKTERYEREKKYKVPRRRGSDEVTATGEKKEIKGSKSKRDNLIKTLMVAGLSREKAEKMADGE